MHSETAPRDGEFIILDEEDAAGKYDAAPEKDHLRRGPAFSFFLSCAAAQPATASDVIGSSCSVAPAPVTVAVGAQMTLVEAPASQARWRFAASLIAASLVVAGTGMYYRGQVAYEATIRKAAETKTAELQQERDQSAALASELATVRRDFDTTAALSSKAADEVAELRNAVETKTAELALERDHAAALASELATVRRDFDTTAALSSKAADEVAELRNAVETKTAELALERDHAAALASELATVRRDFDTTAALSSKAADEVAELRNAVETKTGELALERDHAAALASELATVRLDFDTTATLSSKAANEVAELRNAVETKTAELALERDHAAALANRAPAVAAPVAAPARKLDPDEVATLMDRAKRLIAAGDISPARLLLERAADAEESTAALMLARTYDPDVLGTQNSRNIISDPAMARVWYQRAAQLGSADAQRRLSQLQN